MIIPIVAEGGSAPIVTKNGRGESAEASSRKEPQRMHNTNGLVAAGGWYCTDYSNDDLPLNPAAEEKPSPPHHPVMTTMTLNNGDMAERMMRRRLRGWNVQPDDGGVPPRGESSTILRQNSQYGNIG